MTVYATVAQLNAYLPASAQVETGDAAAVAEAERLLARASEHIESAVRARFRVDPVTKIPTDAEVSAVLTAATVRQYEQWLEVDEANAVDGLAGSSISVAGYSGPRAPSVAPRAYMVLRDAGLTQPVAFAEGLPTAPDEVV